jgi:hypothetical protein
MSVLFCDIETYKNFFYVAFKREKDGHRVGFELSARSPDFDYARVNKIMRNNRIVTFNGQGFDVPLIFYALSLLKKGESAARVCAMVKSKVDAIINGRVRYWEVEDLLKIKLPRIDHIDLIEPQPNAIASLKTLNGRLHGKRMQDLPIPPDKVLTDEEMDVTADYCLHSDLDATHNLWDALQEPLALRVALGAEYDTDFRSKSDSQIGEAIVKKRIEQITGSRPQKVDTKPGTTFKYPIPSFMKFETPELQAILDRLRETEFVVNDKGKVDLPAWLTTAPQPKMTIGPDGEVYAEAREVSGQVTLGSSTYQMGIGGLHSTEANRAVHSDDDYVLIDADVASMYPTIILMLGLFPKSLGKHFLDTYRGIKDNRLKAKRRAKEIKALLKSFDGSAEGRGKLEAELFACEVADKGLKIALNGVFGKLGSRYSILFAPHLLLSTTLTGQLTLLMLIERAVRAGIDVLSGNTDGVLFKCPREWFEGIERDKLVGGFLKELCDEWERDTGFELEFAEYVSVYNQSVNSYFAIKADGGHKRKGPLANPWNKDKSDFDPRAQLMKNPQATICSDAALALIKHGTPIEDTIYGCTDIRQFVTVIKADGGATWRGKYLGKVVRYYWSTDGDAIFKAKAHAKTGNHPMVPKTEGAAPCMTLPDELPDDIDYERYIKVTREILMDIGYDDRPPPPPKMVRLTKANTVPILLLWAMAD